MDALNDLSPDAHDTVAGRVSDFFHDAADRLSSAWHEAMGAARAEALPASPTPTPTPAPADAAPAQPRQHVVRPGETLSGIAQQAGTDWRSLARANNIADPDQLKAGAVLRLPALPQTGPAPQAGPAVPPPAARHVVQPGETLSGIAHQAGTTWQNLARINHISDPTSLRAGATLSLSGTMAGPAGPTSEVHPAPVPAPAGQPHLGDLSMKYETGFTPGHEAQAAGVVSSGRNDPGGVSYGAYQFASSAAGSHQVQAFLKAEGAPWAAAFSGKDPTVRDGTFGAAWKQVAGQQPTEFYAAQRSYIERTHYQPVVDKVKADTNLDVSSRSLAVRNVVWSMSVQHGAARSLIDGAVRQAGPQGGQSDSDYDRKLINTLYDVRDTYVDKIGNPGLKDRYVNERRDALAELARP